MNAYPDTSFLYAIYRPQSNSKAAIAYCEELVEPLHVTDLLWFELRQSLRLQAFRRQTDRRAGIGQREFLLVLEAVEKDLADGVLVRVDCDLREIIRMAEDLSARHTRIGGHRAFDILHVATALHLNARILLSFDMDQRSLATLAGLQTAPELQESPRSN